MSKIIVYGINDLLFQNLHLLNFDDIVCIADDDEKILLNSIYGKNVIRVKRICEFQYDYIVIFNGDKPRKVEGLLLRNGVPQNKIINWIYYLFTLKNKIRGYSSDAYRSIKQTIEELNINSLLDIDGSLIRNCLFGGEKNIFQCEVSIANTGEKPRFNSNFYQKNAANHKDIFDAVVSLDIFTRISASAWEDFWVKFQDKARYFIISIPYECPSSFSEWSEIQYENYGKVKVFKLQKTKLLVIDTKEKNKNLDARIYTVTHKTFIPPQSNLYYPIYAGCDNRNAMGIQGDAEGESIAELNLLINECTSLYWIWKNSKNGIIGLAHYRRYFVTGTGYYWDYWEDNLLDRDTIEKFLAEYDIILAEGYETYPYTLKDALQQTVNPDAFEEGFDRVRKMVEKYQHAYLEDFDIYFNGYYTNKCQMFVSRKKLIDAYCEWLFSILIPACKEFTVKGYDGYSSRMIGFMAERLLSLWVFHNNLKVKELPIIIV